MQPAMEKPAVSNPQLWAGRIISGLVIAFMLFDGVIHLMKIAPVVQAFQELGWPISLSVVLGIIELLCVVIYLYPRTSMLGAILLTGYLGGAVVTQLRVGHPCLVRHCSLCMLAFWSGEDSISASHACAGSSH